MGPGWARPKLPPSFDGFDVVHATNPAGVAAGRADGSALVVTVHDLAFERSPGPVPRHVALLYRAGVRAAARRADAILVPSSATADDLLEYTSVEAAERCTSRRWRPRCPRSPRRPRRRCWTALGVTRPYVLFVGTLEPRKNLVRLVRAYRQIAPDVPHALVLAGPDGWHVEDLDAELAARRARARSCARATSSPEDLDALYRGADAFAYPSRVRGVRAAGPRGDGARRARR